MPPSEEIALQPPCSSAQRVMSEQPGMSDPDGASVDRSPVERAPVEQAGASACLLALLRTLSAES